MIYFSSLSFIKMKKDNKLLYLNLKEDYSEYIKHIKILLKHLPSIIAVILI